MSVNFRSTVAAQQGRYDLITDLFSQHGEHDGGETRHHHILDKAIGNISLEDLYISAAHREHDMIVGYGVG